MSYLHFYAINQSDTVLRIVNNLGLQIHTVNLNKIDFLYLLGIMSVDSVEKVVSYLRAMLPLGFLDIHGGLYDRNRKGRLRTLPVRNNR